MNHQAMLRSAPCLLSAWLVGLLGGCGGELDPVEVDAREQALVPLAACLPDVQCSGAPAVGGKRPWRHGIKSPLVLAAGSPQHRGIDLVAAANSVQQVLRGELKYGLIDKSLEDEDAEVFACVAGAWKRLGAATTDTDGLFTLTLTGANRLPIGRRQLYVSVAGDRSALRMLALITPAGGQTVVSDIDGTLTSSEDAFPSSLVTGATVAAHDGAATALTTLSQLCYHPVYLTSRGRVFTERTRAWLSANGFPAGALRLAPSLVTLPGASTYIYKANEIYAIQAAGVGTAIGIGNRATDAQAYLYEGIQDIFLKRPEYSSEIDPIIARRDAIGVDSYRTSLPAFAAFPKAP